MKKIPTINTSITSKVIKTHNPYKYKGWIEGKATGILESTCVGILNKTYPLSHGNCFSMKVQSAYGNEPYRVLNFCIENLEVLLKRKLVKLPIKVQIIRRPNSRGRGLCVIHDTRIPHEWYYKAFCSTCSPIEFLTPSQRMEKWRKIDSGVLVCQESGWESEKLQAKTRKLKVEWSVDSKQDLKQEMAAAKTMPDFLALPSGILVPLSQAQVDATNKEEAQRLKANPQGFVALKRYGQKKINKKLYATVVIGNQKGKANMPIVIKSEKQFKKVFGEPCLGMSAKGAIMPCDCGRPVVILPSTGGGGSLVSGDATMYYAHCKKCGKVDDNLASNCSGKKRDAIAEWNRDQKAKAKRNKKAKEDWTPRTLKDCESIGNPADGDTYGVFTFMKGKWYDMREALKKTRR